MSAFTLAILGAAALAAFAIALILFGRRGRRINDHPVCRRCAFDLSGHAERPSICPECAADLTRRAAVRTGARRRRPIVLAAGWLLVALLVVGVGLGALNAKKWNQPRFKPTWLLVIEARSRDSAIFDPAVGELILRHLADDLSISDLDAVESIVLDIQADGELPWTPTMMNVLDVLIAADRISDEEHRRLARHALRHEATYPETIRVGDEWHIRTFALRSRMTADWQARWHAESARLHWLGFPDDAQPPIDHNRVGFVRAKVPDTPGDHLADLTYTVVVEIPRKEGSKTRPLAATWTVRHRLAVKVLPADTVDIHEISGHRIDEQIRRAIGTPRLRLQSTDESPRLLVEIPVRNAPTHIGLTGEIRQGDRSWPLMRFPIRRGVTMEVPYTRELEGLQPGSVTVIIRGDADVARSWPNMSSTWVGEIVFENVEIEPADASTTPSSPPPTEPRTPPAPE